MKKFISVILVVIMMACMIPVQAEETQVKNQVRVTYNGFEIPFDVVPRIIGSSTMVPMRAIFELLGAEVEWVGETREVVSTKGNDTYKFAIGSNELYKNGVMIYEMPSPAVIIEENGESRTLVPLRAVSESLGYIVDWNPNTATAIILSPEIYEEIPAVLRMIGNFPVPLDVYNYFASFTRASYGETEEDFFEIPENIANYYRDLADNLYGFYAVLTLADMGGMSIYSPDIQAVVESAYSSYVQYYGDSFETILAADNMTPDVFKLFLFATHVEEVFVEGRVNEFNSAQEYQILDMFKNGQFPIYRAAHILFNDLTVAESVLEQAKIATDEKFFELVKTYSKDTVTDTSTDGYYYTEYHLVPEFESAVKALSNGETSDIVETAAGYHIIRRLPVNEDYLKTYRAELSRYVAQSEYYFMTNTIAETLEELSTPAEDQTHP